MKILLVGNPNVGKSALFSRLTGTRIIASNYPGTTVEFIKGYVNLPGAHAEIIDVPGTYTLDPTSKAEEVAVEMLEAAEAGDIVVDVVDATNLERNLNLTLQLLERGLPVVVVLNMWDEAGHRGVEIDVEKLEESLGVPVIPTVAVSGQGIEELVSRLPQARASSTTEALGEEASAAGESAGGPHPGADALDDGARWSRVGNIVDRTQSLSHRHHTWREVLEDISNHPLGGAAIAILVLLGTFTGVRFVGESIISYVTDPFFEKLWKPVLMTLSKQMGSGGYLHDILIGNLIDGDIDYLQSFGLLSTGVYIPFSAVLPYIVAFYLALGILEDVGYLPRLAVLMDTVMHRLGLHGYAIIPNILGFGCNVPAVMATRILESDRQRFIAATLISIGVPCAALQAMVLGLVGERGGIYVAAVYGSLAVAWVVVGFILNRMVRGYSPELLVEIPPYRIPPWNVIWAKLWLRVRGFVREALPIVLGAVFVVNVLYTLGIFDVIARVTAPVVTGLFGLPRETVVALVLGFLRKDVAVGMLAPLDLTNKQLVISCTVLAMSFPCVATFVVLIRELGARGMLKATLIMLSAATMMGTLQNLVF